VGVGLNLNRAVIGVVFRDAFQGPSACLEKPQDFPGGCSRKFFGVDYNLPACFVAVRPGLITDGGIKILGPRSSHLEHGGNTGTNDVVTGLVETAVVMSFESDDLVFVVPEEGDLGHPVLI
jgi:hypothetical protein